ncbi:hypothetical protein E2542_SST04670 [Spatholobus suberectus]|nr:hypothetical protein E2542_SST04670 [Spatholobus suberectus]
MSNSGVCDMDWISFEARHHFLVLYDQSDVTDHHEFGEEIKKIMLAIADRLGSFPLQMVVEDDPNSLLQKVTNLEASKT